ncbi:hypothetical protein [Natronomonas sp. EA1]|uniref:hypothetical protein n=1 Tax=Natronomonas sp. EA1 TaxID=3421655 RepID=UPI003EB71F59
MFRALLLAWLLVLAGCSSVLPGDPPAAPGDETPAEAPGTLAPGVTEGGVNSLVLAQAHNDALNATSYTVSRTHTDLYLDDRTYRDRQSFVGRYGADGAYLLTYGNPDPTPEVPHDRYELYADGETVVVGGFSEGRAPVVVPALDADGAPLDPADGRYEPLGVQELHFILGAVAITDIRALGPDDAGYERYELSATRFLKPGEVAEGESVWADTLTNLTFTAVVDERGIVHAYDYSYDAVVFDRPLRITESVRVTAIGETDVERPRWLRPGRMRRLAAAQSSSSAWMNRLAGSRRSSRPGRCFTL